MDQQFGQLNEAHAELSQVYEQLQAYSLQAEEAAKIREKNRIAREIHDTVGHEKTALLVQRELDFLLAVVGLGLLNAGP